MLCEIQILIEVMLLMLYLLIFALFFMQYVNIKKKLCVNYCFRSRDINAILVV